MTRHSLCRTTLIISAVFLITACASSYDKTSTPSLLEQADREISKGVGLYNRAEYSKAANIFKRALYSYRAIDNPDGIASSCINLAKTSLSQGNTGAAESWAQSASKLIEQYKLDHIRPHLVIIQSSIAIEKNDYAHARQLLTPVLDRDNKNIEMSTRLAGVQNRTRIAFAEHNDGKLWVERYAQLVSSNNTLHKARLFRFRAALSNDAAEKNRHFQEALEIYRELTHRPGIASTLTEWADFDIKNQDYEQADNKLSRALFIRTELADAYHCNKILNQYRVLYADTNNDSMLATTAYWQTQLGSARFNQWQQLAEAYSSFPAGD